MNDVRAVVFHRGVAQPYAPGFQQAGIAGRRPDGWAFASFPSLAESREVAREDKESDIFEVELSEGGHFRVLNARATDRLPDQGFYAILDSIVVGMTAELVSLAAATGHQMGYKGMWALGVSIRGPVQGLPSHSHVMNVAGLATAFGGDQFTEFAEAPTSELAGAPGDIGFRLVGRFLRSVNLDRSPPLRDLLGLSRT